MNMKKWMLKLGFVFVLALVLTACGGNNGDSANNGNAANNENTATNENGANSGDDVQGFPHITGIEPGAGVMNAAEQAVTEDEEWVVVTGWTPHWKFAAFDLKYLDDPQGIFGGEETINTIVRQGLEEDHPEAYQVLDNFYWETSDMESIMLDIYENDTDPREAAQTWIDNNRDKVDGWIEGVDTVDGESLDLVYVTWDSEIASTNMIAIVLEEIGYDVEITPVDNNPMWQAVADGSHDAMVAAWLPLTHESQYAEFQDQVVDLGPNLEGAKIGLVVPTYVTIDSIEEITAQ